MPTLDGNITTIALADDTPLLALFPTLNTYLPPDATDWSAQRAEGVSGALKAFRIITGKTPAQAKANTDADWSYILAAFTLAVIFLGFIHPGAEEWREIALSWEERSEKAIDQLLYRYDDDASGVLEDTVTEGKQRVGEIRLIR